MIVSDCLDIERIELATIGNVSRWPDQQLITLTDRSVKTMVERIGFPESRLTLTTTGTYQSYQLPAAHHISRVYLNGQICVETPGGFATWEGDQVDFNDQTAQGAVPSGSVAATGGTTMLPQWTIQTPLAYPFLNSWGIPSPRVQTFFPGQRPRYLTDDRGFITFSMPPVSGTIITIFGILIPVTLTQLGQAIVVPDPFMDGIVARTLSWALRSDRDQMTRALAADWDNTFEKEVRLKRTWKRQYSLEDTQFQPITYRSAYRIGGHRAGTGGNW